MIILDGLNRTILLCRDYVAPQLTDAEIASAFQSMRVLCVADALTLSSHSAQTALVTLVSLLSRMGMQVGLKIPDITMVRPQPPMGDGRLRTALISASGQLMPKADIIEAHSDFSPDVVFGLGASELNHRLAPSWHMGWTDWAGSIAAPKLGKGTKWSADWPIGSMVSALLAANEAFKCAMRRLQLRQESDAIFFEPSRIVRWDFGGVSVPQGAVDLGEVDFISAGAISQATLYALMRLPQFRMNCRVFDDDCTAVSNLNRNMLSRVDNIESLKVSVVSSQCRDQCEIQAIPLRFVSGANEGVQLRSRVIVGVDDIPSRWAVQRIAPGWVGVAGTSHFSISSSSHRPGEPCSGCLHPLDDVTGLNPIPTVSFVSFWAGLSTAVRLIRESISKQYTRSCQQLWLTPLRLDAPNAAVWMPVPPSSICPVKCAASRSRSHTA